MNNPLRTDLQALKTRSLTSTQVREVDRRAIEDYGLHSLVLMENAGLGCVRWLEQHGPSPGTATVLCGSGNNGGDGLVIARHLEVLGWTCHVVVLGPLQGLSTDARANLDVLTRSSPEAITVWAPEPEPATEEAQTCRLRDQLQGSSVIFDAMLGTGSRGAPRPPLDAWIRLSNQAGGMRVAVDLPTGLDANSGEATGAYFRADATLTFVAQKPGMLQASARPRFGRIEIVPIGIPRGLIREVLSWPEPD